MSNKEKFIDDFRSLLIDYCGGCAIQEAKDGTLWPCGTCVCALFGSVLDKNAEEYNEHNEQPDRVNEIWRAILQMRDVLPDDNDTCRACKSENIEGCGYCTVEGKNV